VQATAIRGDDDSGRWTVSAKRDRSRGDHGEKMVTLLVIQT